MKSYRKVHIKRIIILLQLFIFILTCYSSPLNAKNKKSAKSDKNNQKIEKKVKKTESSGKKSSSIKENTKDNKDKKRNINPDNKKKKEKKASKEEKALKNEKKRADWIERTIQYGRNKDRREAINMILKVRNKDIKKHLCKKLIEMLPSENDSEVKVKAITVLGELKIKESLPIMLNAINDVSDDVQIAAVYAVKRIGDKSAAPKLIIKLKKQDLTKNSNITVELIHTLAFFKAAKLQKFAIKSVKDNETNKNIRLQLVLFLGKIGDKGSADFLRKLLKDTEEDSTIRAYAANSLSHLGIKSASKDIDLTIKEIESYSFKKRKRYYNLYIYCIAALAKLGDKKALPRLINSLRSDNATVRIRAIRLIKEIKDKRTIDILKYKFKYDPNPKVKKAARKALKELGEDVDKKKKDTPKKKISNKTEKKKIRKTKKKTDKSLKKKNKNGKQ